MIEEPFRWLEAMENRREYVREQIKGGSPVFAASLPEGILLLGVGTGNSKVFELFDRHALAGLGHPADIEKIRQAAIDAAHLEAFTRAPEDVSLRRLVSYGLGPQLKTNFEQIFSAPFLVELLLAEVAAQPKQDLLFRLHFDGGFRSESKGVLVAVGLPDPENAAQTWLLQNASGRTDRREVVDLLLQAWWCLTENKSFTENAPSEEERRAGWRTAVKGKVVEMGWLARKTQRSARFEWLTLPGLGFELHDPAT
ncbi:MAG: 20S proteasome subunit A/B [Verrucomicrobia bacterium]|nr:20S proteasome subunit A/B [Verrucomicrobiota bacterium]